jgi:hypothetical protein
MRSETALMDRSAGLAEHRLELAEDLLDRVEVRRIWRGGTAAVL